MSYVYKCTLIISTLYPLWPLIAEAKLGLATGT